MNTKKAENRWIITGLLFACLGPGSLWAVTNVTATKAQISAFLGGLDAKVVYSEDRKALKFVDLSAAIPAIQTAQSVTPAPQVPSISPDGNFLAYSNKSDGMYNGEGYIQQLSATGVPQKLPGASVVMPRWWVNPWTGDLTVTYVDRSRSNIILYCSEKGIKQSLENPQKYPYCVGKKVGDVKINPWADDQSFLYRQIVVNGMPSGAPVKLARGPWDAGVTRDGQYTCAGQGPGIFFRHMGTNTKIRVFASPVNGMDYNLQVCNTSVGPGAEKTNEVLFVDFGTNTKVSTLVGKAYGIHEVLFVVNAKDETVNWMPAPEPGLRMDNPDWSSHPRYAVTNVRKSSGGLRVFAIYLIDLQTKKYLKIIESDDVNLWHPALWVKYDAPRTPFQATEPPINLNPSGIGNIGFNTSRFQQLALPGFFHPVVNIPEGRVTHTAVYDIQGRRTVLGPGNNRVSAFGPGAYFLQVRYQAGNAYRLKIINCPR